MQREHPLPARRVRSEPAAVGYSTSCGRTVNGAADHSHAPPQVRQGVPDPACPERRTLPRHRQEVPGAAQRPPPSRAASELRMLRREGSIKQETAGGTVAGLSGRGLNASQGSPQ